jgi:hypothetical protein
MCERFERHVIFGFRPEFQPESLILAQNERWRQA